MEDAKAIVQLIDLGMGATALVLVIRMGFDVAAIARRVGVVEKRTRRRPRNGTPATGVEALPGDRDHE